MAVITIYPCKTELECLVFLDEKIGTKEDLIFFFLLILA